MGFPQALQNLAPAKFSVLQEGQVAVGGASGFPHPLQNLAPTALGDLQAAQTGPGGCMGLPQVSQNLAPGELGRPQEAQRTEVLGAPPAPEACWAAVCWAWAMA
jgi:hypothetical protein